MTINSPIVQQPVAIIGMGGMFAKASDLKAYWRNLLTGTDCISDPPPTHGQLTECFDSDPARPDHIYCNRGGFLPTIPFDPMEFGIPPTALEATDTSQLLGLVTAKMALSDAGYGDNREFDREHTSVILGVTGTQELVIALGSRLGHPFWRKALANKGLSDQQQASIIDEIANSYVPWQENSFPGLLGNVVAGRICNRLNLGGTNCVVDAACASSLSAVHLALMELYAGKSNMVVTGGVDTINDIFMHMCFAKTGVLSHSGNARPFSANADGTVLGEGIGILVLKRLIDAERDGDRIYAVIRGIGSSSDGRSQSIYAPRAEGQVRALLDAYRSAGIAPETVELVEAHGTGTRVGDEVEFTALKKVFGAVNPNGNRCALGSVKSMIGHTKAAAGAAGLIKATLALYNKVLPPTLKVERPDPRLELESSPFYLNTAARPWFRRNGNPRRSGVSAFGFGGSNFHVVVEEYRTGKDRIAWDGSVEILAFSGADSAAISKDLMRLKGRLDGNSDPALLSRTARTLRADFSTDHPCRLIVVADTTRDIQALQDQLQAALTVATAGQSTGSAAQGIYYNSAAQAAGPNAIGRIAFMFPGQGSQYVDMGRELACRFPGAMQAIEDADSHCDASQPLWEVLYPRPALSDDQRRQQTEALRRTDVAQPAIGAVSLAMLSILDYFKLRPDAVCGHSYGELPALHAAGWIDRATLLRLSVTRGRLMAEAGQNGDAGTMLAVKAPVAKLKELVAQVPEVVLANINSPDQGVLSGTTAAIASAEAACSQKGYRSVALPVAAAFHSPLVEGAGAPFAQAVAKAAIDPTRIPVYANVTAAPYPADTTQAADLLSRQLTSPVRFQETIEHLYDVGVRTFIEVGPKAVLGGLVRATLKDKEVAIVALDRSMGKAPAILDLAHAIGQLAALGVAVDLNRWESELPAPRPQKMAIPLSGANYRFPRQQKPTARSDQAAATATVMPASQPTGSPTFTMDPSPKPMDNRKPMHAIPPEKPANQPGTMQPAGNAGMNAALDVVRKGLESIQALQQQTAQTHQKFLETQAQASRTLQDMLKSTQLLVGSVLGSPMASVVDVQASAVNPVPITAFPAAMENPAAKASAAPSAPPIAATVPPPATAASAMPPPQPATSVPSSTPLAGDSVSRTLIGIVAELTGYPENMLGMEMDIEADLGIDSIKRVEILSAMEERMPHLPQVTPEMVGTLKTLGQICDFLAADGPSVTAATAAAIGPAAPPAQDAQAVPKTLLAVVAQLTGYPEDMLGLEMDIEADLGIDSIKRVEILSAMEERMPHLPRVTPEMVGTLKTLGQICDFLAADGPSVTAATAAANGPAAPPTRDAPAVPKTLLAVVAQLTGYPEDMLGMEMDIEADLGIDSIKRVEILSAMEERMPHLPRVTPEMVGTLKTLGQICDFLSGSNTRPADDLVTHTPPSASPEPAASSASPPRQIVDVVEQPKMPGRGLLIEAGRWVGVLDDRTAMTPAIVDQLQDSGIPARAIPMAEAGSAACFIGAAGLIIGGAIDPETAFLAAKNAAAELIGASNNGDALLATVTCMDGAFGFSGNAFTDPEQGALPGLVKTAELEWESVICRAIDLAPGFADPRAAAAQVVAELQTVCERDPVEIGLHPDRRVTLQPVPVDTVDGSIDLDKNDLVVVTGGARGVTAACALSLARASGAAVALIGRSAAPFAIPGWLQGIDGEAAMKKAIAANDLPVSSSTPQALASAYRKHAANLAITQTLDALQSLGVRAGYFRADVTDRQGLNEVLSAVRHQMGPITGLIHGAGILHDRLIVDKTVDQFRQVYATKVDGLKNLLAATESDNLRHLVLFSSVSARTGNVGQCDYAMANEALNKMARLESLRRSGCRVTAINWGPWDGGMVTPALKKVFNHQGIALIPMQTGARLLVAEMQNAAPVRPVEVLIGSMLTRENATWAADASASPMTLLERRELDLKRYPVLASHVIGGKPVVPFALIGEWIGHGALKENPGFALHGIDDFRLLSGIRIEQESKLVRLMAGKARKNGHTWQVDVELRNGVKNGKDVIHSRARALLVDRFPEAPVFSGDEKNGSRAYPRDLDAIYGKILFHGEQLRAIEVIEAYGDHGMTARLTSAPQPEAWMQDPIQGRWMADPLVLDGAFQMAIVWCFEQTGKVCLPSYARAYRQYRAAYPSAGVQAVMAVTASTPHKMVADFTVLDDERQVVATLTGYEATIDESLMHAFENNALQTVIARNPE